MIENLNDLYRYAQGLREELAKGPDADLALEIETAFGGTTSGEILNGLWFALRKARNRTARFGPGESDLDDSIAFIQEALGSPP